MATYPVFSVNEVLTADDMNAVGLWKITSKAMSTATTTIDGCFTADYRDYRLVITGTSTSGTASDLICQFRTSGTTNGTANYYSNIMYNTHAAGPSRSYLAAQTQAYCGQTASPSFSNVMDLFAPYETFTTSGVTLGNGFGTTTAVVSSSFFNFNATTSFDGISIANAAGQSLTGTITVYGYRK